MMLKKLTKMLIPCILLAAFAVGANAQNRVSGKVVDDDGQPVAGATVLVVGTTIGVQTDFEGTWTLQVPDPLNDVLEFNCLGYETVEEPVNNRGVINVVLSESNEALEEVVFVGYGTQKKVNLTGAVTAINFDEIAENRTIVSTSAALAGLSPGMMVRQTTAQPGVESSTIRIRGTGSFTSSASSPLVLVDGVEWNMDDINPNDIESISVLKDASSTAIYGTRAANGVILITTKKGEEGKPIISYSYNASWQTAVNKFKWVSDFADYCEYLNEAADMSGTAHPFSDFTIDTWREKKKDPYGLTEYGVPNYKAYPNTDWFDALFDTGFTQQHELTVSGGNKGVRYMVSGSYLDNTGIITKYDINSSAQKATFRTNLEADVTKWFTIGTRLYGQFMALGAADLETVFSWLYKTSPGIYPGEPGAWGIPACSEDSPNSNNLLSYSYNKGTGPNHTWKLNGTVYGIIRPYKGLSIEGDFNYAPTFQNKHIHLIDNSQWDYTTNTPLTIVSMDDVTEYDYAYRDYYVNTDVLIRYDTVIKKEHALNVLVGMSTTDYLTWIYQVQMKGATDFSLDDGSTYSSLDGATYSAKEGWRLRSYFARVNYGFKDRYLFEANVRIDGSSVFGSNNRYGVFPSFSAGWKIHEEPWMAGSRSWLSELKLRASWGETGNNQGLGYYTWQSTYSTGNVVVDGSNSVGLYIASMSNPDLKWETTSSTDIGIDAAFFNNRLTVGLDYYYKGTRDILYTPSTYLTMGNFSQVPSNLGNMWNQGIELSLNWKDQAGNFYYWVGANVSYNVNKVTNFKGKLVQGLDSDGNFYTNYSDVAEDWNSPGVLIEGHAIGEHYIYKLYRGTGAGYSSGAVNVNAGPKDGMIRTEADMAWVKAMIDAGYTFNGQSTISKDALWYGDFIYADLNGDGNYGNTYDKYFTGKSDVPTVNLGLNFGFAWKGLEFSMIWSGAFDFSLNWTTPYYNTSSATLENCVSKRIAENHYFYDPENPSDSRTNINGKYPRLYNGTINNEASDFYEYKGDYFKLKNVTLAYTLPVKWTKQAFINKLKFYVSGENLATITSYPGMDPEIGIDVAYPLMRQYTIGAQITF